MFLTPADLEPFATIDAAKAALMIEDAEAMAVLAAPCLSDPEFADDAGLVAAVKAILRGAILRWDEAGAGAVTQQGAGPFQQTVDTTKTRRGMFWPSELDQLRGLCARFTGKTSGAFSVDTVGYVNTVHADTCSLYFGAAYCDCGADIAGFPLYGGAA